MADTPEKKVKNKLVAQLKLLGAYYFYPVTGGYGASGVPDVICCYKGGFFAFECKAGTNKPTKLQDINIEAIRKAGGHAIVVNEENVGVMTQYLVGVTNDPAE